MTEAEVHVIFTITPTEEQISQVNELFANLGLRVSIGAPRPRP